MSNGKVIDMDELRRDMPYRKWVKTGLFILLLILISFLLLANIFIVKEGEYKIVRQFGEVKRVIDKPGIHLDRKSVV